MVSAIYIHMVSALSRCQLKALLIRRTVGHLDAQYPPASVQLSES